MVGPIPVMLAIDLEPEAIAVERDGSSSWSGCREAFQFVNALRESARKDSGNPAAVTWALRMDHQIEVAYGSAEHAVRLLGSELADAERRGDEIGLHTHFYRWEDATKRWRIEHGDPDWVERCLRESFATYSKVFMRRCAVYRGGERWHSNSAVQIVESLGVSLDMTLERGRPTTPTLHPDVSHSGALPDYTTVPLGPFQPSTEDYRVASVARDRSIWMLPCAGGQVGYQPEWRRPWKRSVVDMLDPSRRLKSLYIPYTCELSAPAREFRTQIRAYIAEPGFSYIVLPVRSNSIVHPDRRGNIVENLTFLMRELGPRGFEFARPRRAMELLGIGIG